MAEGSWHKLGGSRVTKYDAARVLVSRKARSAYDCSACQGTIEKNTPYYVESLGLIRPQPGMTFRKLCIDCYEAGAGWSSPSKT